MPASVPTTSTPFTYLLDYATHLDAPEDYVAKVAQAPPHLLHVGHDDTPFDNTWGAFPESHLLSMGGNAPRLSPEDMRERIALIRDYVDRLHDVGVEILIPYICNQTLGGNWEKRTGIWDFYDHWEEYAEFDFGEKPEVEPIEWMARERNGRVHYNYERRHFYFTRFDQDRYAPCPNNPYYNRYQRGVVINIAKVGYDGIFVDNNILNCYCRHCQEKFEEYLSAKYPAAELKDRFGFEEASQIRLGYLGSPIEWVKDDPEFRSYLSQAWSAEDLERDFGTSDLDDILLEEAGNWWPWRRAKEYLHYLRLRYGSEELTRRFGGPDLSLWGIKTPRDRALWAATKRFRAQSTADNLAMIKQIGNSVREGFFLVPNCASLQQTDKNHLMGEFGRDLRLWQPNIDGIMFEEFTDPGMITRGLYLDFILEYKLAFAHRVKPTTLCVLSKGENALELVYAESAAGGGGCFVHEGLEHPEIRRKYNTFFREHAALWEGYHSHAEVALAYCCDQVHMENVEHLRQVYKVTRYLSDQHILFDHVIEDDLSAARLSRYRVLILPEVRYMDDAHIQGVERFVAGGGTLVLTGETGHYDGDGKARTTAGFGKCLYSGDLSDLLPEDRVSRDDALLYARSELVAKLEVPGDARYYAMAQLDRTMGVDSYLDGGKLLGYLESGLGYPPAVADAFEGAGVRFNAYVKEEGSRGSLVLHAVNYNLPLVGDGLEGIMPVDELAVQVRIPEGWEIDRVRALEPGAPPQPLTFRADGRLLKITLPAVAFYRLIDIHGRIERE